MSNILTTFIERTRFFRSRIGRIAPSSERYCPRHVRAFLRDYGSQCGWCSASATSRGSPWGPKIIPVTSFPAPRSPERPFLPRWGPLRRRTSFESCPNIARRWGEGGKKNRSPPLALPSGPRYPNATLKKKKNYLYPFFLFVFFVPRSSRRLPRLNRGEEGREKRNESTWLQHHEVTTT